MIHAPCALQSSPAPRYQRWVTGEMLIIGRQIWLRKVRHCNLCEHRHMSSHGVSVAVWNCSNDYRKVSSPACASPRNPVSAITPSIVAVLFAFKPLNGCIVSIAGRAQHPPPPPRRRWIILASRDGGRGEDLPEAANVPNRSGGLQKPLNIRRRSRSTIWVRWGARGWNLPCQRGRTMSS